MCVPHSAARSGTELHGPSTVCLNRHSIPRGRGAGAAHSLHAARELRGCRIHTQVFYQWCLVQSTDVDPFKTHLYAERTLFNFPDFCFWQRIF